MCTVCKLISILNVWMLCYTGSVQTFTAPSATTYKLEVWGAQGGGATSTNQGGYAYGKASLTTSNTLYVCVGSQPTNTTNGGYNGGGNAGNSGQPGGGATHIAKTLVSDGQLRRYSSTYSSSVFLVAGGGGGSDGNKGGGGSGGGTTGGTGGSYDNESGSVGYGGSQTAAGGPNKGGFGYGGNAPGNGSDAAGAGGGGFYGGGGCTFNAGSGGGGSGYTNTSLLQPGTYGMQNGARAGHGYARITWMPVL